MHRHLILLALLCLAIASPAWGRVTAQQRCGWLINPTPGNWSLRDREDEWTISNQGGYQAGGVDLPDMSARGWVVTNGMSYGYGCACLSGVFNAKTKQLSRLLSARALSLHQCRADKRLPKP